MATNNFYSNSSKIYSIELDQNNNQDYDFINCYIDDLQNDIITNLYNFSKPDKNSRDVAELRSYGSRVIAEKREYSYSKSLNYSTPTGKDEYFYSKSLNSCYYDLQIVLRDGYYQGNNFDINIEFFLEGEECEAFDLIHNIEDIDVIDENIKNYKTIIRKAKKWLIKDLKAIDKFLSDLTQPIKKIGGFSDGSAVYETIN